MCVCVCLQFGVWRRGGAAERSLQSSSEHPEENGTVRCEGFILKRLDIHRLRMMIHSLVFYCEVVQTAARFYFCDELQEICELYFTL